MASRTVHHPATPSRALSLVTHRTWKSTDCSRSSIRQKSPWHRSYSANEAVSPRSPTLQKRKQDGTQEPWMVQKAALRSKFGDSGWQPRKRLSPDAMEGIRTLHAQDAVQYSVPYLANQFEVSPEAVRRILKSSWRPKPEEEVERYERWKRRGQSVWDRWAELGYKPPEKWRRVSENEKPASDELSTSEPRRKSPRGSQLSQRIM